MKRCSNANRYQGLKKPKCNGGKPCLACKTKFKAVQSACSKGCVPGGEICEAWFDCQNRYYSYRLPDTRLDK